MIYFAFLLYYISAFAFTEEQLGKKLNFGIGADLTQAQYKQGRFEISNYSSFQKPIENIFSKVSWNITYRPFTFPLWIGARTNWGINTPVKYYGYDTVAKQHVRFKTKGVSNSLYIGTALNKYILPFVIATDYKSKTTIYYTGFDVNSKKHALLYGFGISSLLLNNTAFSFTYYLGNDVINTKRTIVLSATYII